LALGSTIVCGLFANDVLAGDGDDTRTHCNNAFSGCILELLRDVALHDDVMPSFAALKVVDRQRKLANERLSIPSKPWVTTKMALELYFLRLGTFCASGCVWGRSRRACRGFCGWGEGQGGLCVVSWFVGC